MAETKKYVRIKTASVDGVWYADKIGQIFEVVRENSVAILTKCGGHHSVLREDVELIVTEKRKAAVGERILITKALAPSGVYKNGDILKVREVEHRAVTVEEVSHFIVDSEYEVIVNSEVKNEEADEMEIDLNAMGYDELIAHGEEVMRMIRIRAYGEGYKQGKFDADMDATYMRPQEKSAQAHRDEIVEQAKADVEELAPNSSVNFFRLNDVGIGRCNVNFIVNRSKGAVVALIKGWYTDKIYAKGIAKAAPTDCFNVHIGKAIALRRALGLAVPDEYLNAPQPTEVRVGDVVRIVNIDGRAREYTVGKLENGRAHDVDFPSGFTYLDAQQRYGIPCTNPKVIDDSREEVGE